MEPSLEELRELYNAAEEFRKAAPWKWMFDNDIFVVQNPETSENAYISIMGNGEEHYGVAGYLGGEGLYSLDRVMYDAEKDIDVALMQKCLMCSFLSRDMLGKEDYQIIKDLGLKPRGKNAWAEFKIYEPGLYPWFINASQCRFMTHILRQSLIVSQEVKDDKSRLELVLKNNKPHLLARILIDGIWTETKIQADTYSPQFTSFHFTDEFKIRKLAKVKPGIKIEADAFFMPTPVMEGPRPFYPKICILLEKSSGAPIYCETLRSLESDGQKVLDGLYLFVEQTGKKPSIIYVRTEEMYFLLLDTCKQVGIEIQMVPELEMAEGFKASMFSHFGYC